MLHLFQSNVILDTNENIIVAIAGNLIINDKKKKSISLIGCAKIISKEFEVKNIRLIGNILSQGIITADYLRCFGDVICKELYIRKCKCYGGKLSSNEKKTLISANKTRIGTLINDQYLCFECSSLNIDMLHNSGAIIAMCITSDEIESSGLIFADTIKCKKIDMRDRNSNKNTKSKRAFHKSLKNNVTHDDNEYLKSNVRVIKADEAYLENIICESVFAKHVVIGMNCQIKEVVYIS